MSAEVVAVHRDCDHRFSKLSVPAIRLRAGLGVVGDAHFGQSVQHRSRVARDPSAPNLRQVHLVAAELLDELVVRGFRVGPGVIGENITTSDVDLLGLPSRTRLRLRGDAEVEITGLRSPCAQLDRYQNGLQRAVLSHDEAGRLIRRAGVMGVVVRGGVVRVGDPITVSLPAEHGPLEPV